MNEVRQQITFTRTQVEYMQKMFPEIVGTASTPLNELQWRSAQRSVIAFLASRQAIVKGE